MEMQREKGIMEGSSIHWGPIEGVILVGGRPQIERADMPLSFSFDSIEELERFCEAAKSRNQDQH